MTDRHHLIVVYKTAYYSFYLPVALAMHMSGVTSEAAYKQASDILVPLGEYFQVQDDYLDCYGDPKMIGKIGTDILDNKCSWLINVALKHVNKEQRAILDVRLHLLRTLPVPLYVEVGQQANYGRKDSAAEAKVKAVFKELDLAGKFEAYEADSHKRITSIIDAVDESSGVKKEVFTAFLNKVGGTLSVSFSGADMTDVSQQVYKRQK